APTGGGERETLDAAVAPGALDLDHADVDEVAERGVHGLFGDAEKLDQRAHRQATIFADHVEEAVVEAAVTTLAQEAVGLLDDPPRGEVQELHRLVELGLFEVRLAEASGARAHDLSGAAPASRSGRRPRPAACP